METLLLLYPVELSAILYVSLVAAFLIGGTVWKKRAKARGNYSHMDELHRTIAFGMPIVSLFFFLDVMMYRFGADLSSERLRRVVEIFFIGVAWSIYFGFIVPKVFQFDYARLLPKNSSLQNTLWGGLIFALAALWTMLFLDFFIEMAGFNLENLLPIGHRP